MIRYCKKISYILKHHFNKSILFFNIGLDDEIISPIYNRET